MERLFRAAPCYRQERAWNSAALVRRTAVLAVLTLTACIASAQSSSPAGLAGSVNPLIGTGAGPGGGVNLFPGATTP
ncbi:MAG TPA: hypothetical protein VE178_06080, partial [Silvibacterium sp.]|nr:hypothetical protein [Silvibacterium sp.]